MRWRSCTSSSPPDGEIQPLHAVRGVLDPDGKAVNRYDKAPAPAQEGDAIAARLVTTALQQAVVGGTGAASCSPTASAACSRPGKTGTSNDSRDSWFAGYTGDHLAVVWVGNDQNQPTGLYGATGAMKVWSGIFSRLPSAPLQVADKGLDWQWVVQSNSTDADCPGARRFAFVAGFAPAYQPCVYADPDTDPYPATAGAGRRRSAGVGWRDWFGFGNRDAQRQQAPPPAPQPAPPPPPPPSDDQ